MEFEVSWSLDQKMENSNNADKRTTKLQRNRVRTAQRANEQKAYLQLKEIVPSLKSLQKKASKLDTLKHTCAYIKFLRETLNRLEEMKKRRDEE